MESLGHNYNFHFSEYRQIAPHHISTNLPWLAVYKSTYSLTPSLAFDIFQVLHFYRLEKVALRVGIICISPCISSPVHCLLLSLICFSFGLCLVFI